MSETRKRVLSALLIVGAQSSEKAESTSHLAERLGVDVDSLENDIVDLQSRGYVILYTKEGVKKAYLTSTGIVTASSTYS